MAKLIEACAGMTSARTKVDSIGGSLREGWGRLSQVENHTGANPRVKGRVFHSFSGHLLSTYCVLSPRLCPGLFHMQPGRRSGFVSIRFHLLCIVGQARGIC